MIQFIAFSSLAVFYLVEAEVGMAEYLVEKNFSRWHIPFNRKPLNCKLCMSCWWALVWTVLYRLLVQQTWDNFVLIWWSTAGIALLLTDIRQRIRTQII